MQYKLSTQVLLDRRAAKLARTIAKTPQPPHLEDAVAACPGAAAPVSNDLPPPGQPVVAPAPPAQGGGIEKQSYDEVQPRNICLMQIVLRPNPNPERLIKYTERALAKMKQAEIPIQTLRQPGDEPSPSDTVRTAHGNAIDARGSESSPDALTTNDQDPVRPPEAPQSQITKPDRYAPAQAEGTAEDDETLSPESERNLREQLAICEKLIHEGKKAWSSEATALTQIRDQRLYRVEKYKDFSSYCKERLNLGKSTVNRWINIGEVFSILASTGAKVLPTSERQLRPLLSLRQKDKPKQIVEEQIGHVWSEVVNL